MEASLAATQAELDNQVKASEDQEVARALVAKQAKEKIELDQLAAQKHRQLEAKLERQRQESMQAHASALVSDDNDADNHDGDEDGDLRLPFLSASAVGEVSAHHSYSWSPIGPRCHMMRSGVMGPGGAGERAGGGGRRARARKDFGGGRTGARAAGRPDRCGAPETARTV
jgi:hypothetical protein